MNGKEKEEFLNKIKIIAANFNRDFSNTDWLKDLLKASESFSHKNLMNGLEEVNRMTTEEWNKKYGYGGKPTIGDFVKFFGQNKKEEKDSLKITSSLKSMRLINMAISYKKDADLLSDEGISKVVKIFGGLEGIRAKIVKEDEINREQGKTDFYPICPEIKKNLTRALLDEYQRDC